MKTIIVFLGCIALVATEISAQIQMPRSVMGAGGGVSSDGRNIIRGTASQTAIGRITGQNRRNDVGFWYAAQQLLRASSAGALIVIPSVEAEVGKRITIPLLLQGSSNLFRTSARKFTAKIRFNASVAEPVNSTGYTRVGDVGTVSVSGEAKDTSGILAQIEFQTKLGNAEKTELVIEEFRWLETDRVKIIQKDGQLALTGLCREGDTVRLIKRSVQAGLMSVYPNPAAEHFSADIQTAENGHTELYLTDMSGRRYPPFFTGTPDAGIRTIECSAGDEIPAGAYYLMLRTPSELFTLPVVIRK